MPSPMQVGAPYISLATTFLRTHSIPDGVDFAITNVDNDKVSLMVKHSNGKLCPSELTIAKSYFGTNFSASPYAPVNASYAHSRHFYPEVSAAGVPLLPSPLHPRKP